MTILLFSSVNRVETNSMTGFSRLSLLVRYSFFKQFHSLLHLFSAMRIIDRSHARITDFKFAVELNKIEYTERYVLNHNTLIHWTVR